MLTVRTRQTYLKELGFYKGAIDNIEGPQTKAAYLALQKKYFTRAKDKDGLYGNDTEKLLVNAYYVKKYTRNFDLTEFRCKCGKHCTGYPVKLSSQLLINAQKVRDKYGATTISSSMRCRTYNNSLPGSSKTSKHMDGKAMDFYVAKCKSQSGRQEVMAYVKSLAGHSYTYCNINGSHPNMGNYVHMDVK